MESHTPKAFTSEDLPQGTPVEVSLVKRGLLVRPMPDSGVTLDALLQSVTPENLHHEGDTGPAVGKEVW